MTLLPAIPSPADASLDVLRSACTSVQAWADSCDDVDAAVEALAKVSAIETYLSKKGQDAEAQGAARWLEVRIGQLLGPASPNGAGLVASNPNVLTATERHRFRQMAQHADLVADLIPTSRAKVLKAIKLANGSVLPARSAPRQKPDWVSIAHALAAALRGWAAIDAAADEASGEADDPEVIAATARLDLTVEQVWAARDDALAAFDRAVQS